MYHYGDLLGPHKIKMLNRTTKLNNGHWKAMFICPYCGKEFESIINQIVSGNTVSCKCRQEENCKAMGKSNRVDLTNKRFGKLVVIEDTGKRTVNGSVVWKCKCDCGQIKNISAQCLRDGSTSSCGCLKSRGEERIGSLLKELNIHYITQYTFNGKCINPETNHCLYFDFYIPEYNCCIEFHGKQHYEESPRCNDTLLDRQKRDNIKYNWCISNNVNIIVIPYFDYQKINKKYLNSLLTNLKN